MRVGKFFTVGLCILAIFLLVPPASAKQADLGFTADFLCQQLKKIVSQNKFYDLEGKPIKPAEPKTTERNGAKYSEFRVGPAPGAFVSCRLSPANGNIDRVSVTLDFDKKSYRLEKLHPVGFYHGFFTAYYLKAAAGLAEGEKAMQIYNELCALPLAAPFEERRAADLKRVKILFHFLNDDKKLYMSTEILPR